MGYYVSIEESTWAVPAENLDAAYRAVCDLNERHDLKRGGKMPYSGNPYVDRWFSWMDPRYPEKAEDLVAVLDMLGFEVHEDGSGVRILSYSDKTGQEDLFLNAIAPYSDPASYIVWRGEDGEMERWEIRNGRLFKLTATIFWENPRELVPEDAYSHVIERNRRQQEGTPKVTDY